MNINEFNCAPVTDILIDLIANIGHSEGLINYIHCAQHACVLLAKDHDVQHVIM